MNVSKQPELITEKTVDTVFEEMMIRKRKLRVATKMNYNYLYYHFISPEIGKYRVDEVDRGIVNGLFESLLARFSYGTVKLLSNITNQIFRLALDQELISRNPANGVIEELQNKNDLIPTKRTAMYTWEQQEFMRFVKSNQYYSKYYDLFVIFLGTGGRAAEILGLTWKDIDLVNGLISINHNLIYIKDLDGRFRFKCGPTKTPSSIRMIPMFGEVREALLRVRAYNEAKGFESVSIDGYSDFIFLNRNGNPHHPCEINRVMKKIIEAYNDGSAAQIRPFSVHSFRHTFATNLCMNESNLKLIQSVMGHSNINITMNVYAECRQEELKRMAERLEGTIMIGNKE